MLKSPLKGYNTIMTTMFNRFTIFLVVLLSVAPYIQAEELRIVDLHGLTRLVRRVSDRIDLKVVTQTVDPLKMKEIRLVDQGGVSADIMAQPSSRDQIIFKGVGAGSWKLTGIDPAQVGSVDLVKPEQK